MDPGDHTRVESDDVDFVALAAGQTVGRYEIIATLGQGSFGITYRARDTRLGRDVAIKEYLPSALAIRHNGATVLPRSTKVSTDFTWGRDRFVAEGQTLASLQNAPAIVRVFDFLETNGTAYIVMQLLSGETLEGHLKRKGRLTPSEVDRILWPLLDGLEQVHNTGFLHRDIKPSNILLDAEGNATLIDFGASRAAMAGRTVAMTAIFTPGYAAAEQFTSAKQGPWTDIYGLAATLYQAIAGKIPPSAFDRMVEDDYEPLATLRSTSFAPGLLQGLDTALAVRAADRPQNIANWRSLLKQTGTGDGAATVALPRPTPTAAVASAGATTSEATPAPSRKKAAVWTAATVTALLMLAGSSYLAFAPLRTSVAPPTADSAAERTRIDQEVQRARVALAAAEQAAQRQAEEEAKQAAAEAAKRKAEADAAEKLRAEGEARSQAAAQSAQQRAEAEAAGKKAEADATAQRKAEEDEARRKAETETAERQRIQQEVQKARDALAVAEAARRQAEGDAARFKAEAEAASRRQAETEAKQKVDTEARQKAEAEAIAKQKADTEAAATAAAAKLQADTDAAKQKADTDAAAKQKADAEAAATQKEQDGDRKAAEVAETALRLTTPDRQRIQVALSAAGFDTRGADGAFGPRSREMIAAWQRRQNLPTTGFLTAAQRDELMRSAAPAISRWEDEQKKADEARKKAEADAKAAAAATSAQPAAAVPPAAAPPAPQQQAPTPAAAASFDGAWTLSISPSGGSSRACSKVVSARLTFANGYAASSLGPVFVNRTGGISGTLLLNDGSGNTAQVILRGSVGAGGGSGQISGGCNGTFALSR